MSDAVHPAAVAGYTASADTYVSGRPGYPAEVGDWLRETLALGPGRTALEVGAGTGKFLPRLVETNARVIALEPVDAMRAALAQRNPEVTAIAGTAQEIPLADASVDSVICAQAFHWFATTAALAEMRRVLRIGGTLGLIWNVRDESMPWMAALEALVEPYAGDAPRYRSGAWRAVFPAPGFEPLPERRVPHPHVGDPEKVIVDRTLSVSFVAALPPAEQQRIAARVRALIAATPELVGRDTISFPYETRMYAWRRTS
ncbi:methyltransferase domain-containing protein [Sphingomonas kyeonggiensis]|uniref:SAM-dependent methyltransferase n=1 Tax=Sphingomonas kyeonggiensis TaxID=1268553 RepID=A0A7W6JNF2_9SPHN|nr:SAM-dependent methyltransferase [Sphingomonas kyeonggiensis]